MNRVVVGIGSNIDPYKHIKMAVDCIGKDHRLVKTSALTVTAPIGYVDQPDFVNGAVLVETGLDADAFTSFLKKVEVCLGRVKTENKFGPRTIDLDVVVWNDTIVDDDFYTRDFLRSAVNEVLQ
jgi:2-amino-4-hydroxy-6-hydroxymethyldihydropteridine diphosphokinase